VRSRTAGGKDGWALGRKARETRQRLLSVTGELLKTTSPFNLSVAAIAKAAQTAAGTFYVYFEDVQDLLYALCVEAGEETAQMVASHPEWFTDPQKLGEDCQSFIDGFTEAWDKHSHALLYGSLEADRGVTRFLDLRTQNAAPVINLLAAAIRAAKPDRSAGEALADGVVLYAAIERLAASSHMYYPANRPGPTFEQLRKAQTRLLRDYLTPRAQAASSRTPSSKPFKLL
jgi:AcrR family transcriptional regulator